MVNLKDFGWSDKELMRLVSLERSLLEELVEDQSEVKNLIAFTIIRVVLENSSKEERNHFKKLITQDEQKELFKWLSSRVQKNENQIIKELKIFFNNKKLEIIKGKKQRKRRKNK